MFNNFLLDSDEQQNAGVSLDQLWQQPVLLQTHSLNTVRDVRNPIHLQSWILQTLDLAEQHVQRVCANCGNRYTEWNNISQMQCRYHPGTFRNCRYTCCDSVVPCQRCDHRVTAGKWSADEIQLAIPLHLVPIIRPVHQLKPVYENVEDTVRSYVYVLRAAEPGRDYQTKPLKI